MSDTQDGESAFMQYFGGNSTAAVKYLLESFWEECQQERPELQKLTELGRQFLETKNNVKDATKAAFLSAKDVARVKIGEVKQKLPQPKPPVAPKGIVIDSRRMPTSSSDPYDQPEVARRRGLRRKRAATKGQTAAASGKQEETNPDKILEDLKSKFQSHMRKSVFDYLARRLYQILALKACENPTWSQDLSEEAYDKKLHVEPTGCPVLPRPDDVSKEEFKQLQYATRAQALLIQEGLTDEGFKSIVTQMEYNVKNAPKNGANSDVDVCTEEGRKAVDQLFPLHFAPAGAPSVNCSPPDSEFNKWRSNLGNELDKIFANTSAIPSVSILGLESDGIKQTMEELEKLLKEIEADPDIPQAEKEEDKKEFENMKREAEAILAAGDQAAPETTPSKKGGNGKNAGSKGVSGTIPPAGKKNGNNG
ncbi:hypothetical protein DdX_21295 [Ditylenchus destructor]|uniref:Uncharacterized protein n=1 Tax=Ditylenchus destructor TaxID=166010 RepID=A0AAD4QVV0_9BILA|nr:hypothetical protein DdX_21295 [Ditylenchus destructor]